jgi:predicted secreted Zn-dependent protease
LLLLALLAAGCAVGAGAQPPASSPPVDVSVISQRTSQGPKVTLRETVTRILYPVEGASMDDIRGHLRAETDGSAGYDALTRWNVHWSFRFDRSSGGCRLAAALIDLTIDISLPRLSAEAGLNPDAAQRWHAYVAALEEHEMGHAGRESAVVEALKDALEAAGPAADCSALGADLNAIGNDYVTQISLVDAAYDAETGHGATQGAVLP